VHRHFPLHPDVPEEGLPLATAFRGREQMLAAARRRLGELMRAEGLAYSAGDSMYNTRLAQELGAWGEAEGVGAIHDALFHAYFADNVNVAHKDALVGIAESVGLSGAEARRALDERAFAAQVDADWERARLLGVTGVPTFVASGRAIVGFQPYALLARLVEAAGAKPAR
jgi:predicted DsbA family dithiol-disulfide isomerase